MEEEICEDKKVERSFGGESHVDKLEKRIESMYSSSTIKDWITLLAQCFWDERFYEYIEGCLLPLRIYW